MALDLSLMDTKEYKAFAKIVGDKQAKELLEKSDDDLKAVISSHTVSIAQAADDTKKASAYAAAVAVTKDFNAALREKNKPLLAAVKLAAKTLCSRK